MRMVFAIILACLFGCEKKYDVTRVIIGNQQAYFDNNGLALCAKCGNVDHPGRKCDDPLPKETRTLRPVNSWEKK